MTTKSIQEIHTGEEFSRRYAIHRPVYSEAVFDTIISYHRQSEKAGFDLALDVGCGTGQGTLPLAKYFDQVIGVDVSKDQIANAPKDVKNVSFRVEAAEDLTFLQSGTVDLVTIATAVHWVDLDRFFCEVDRILKPGGSLVVYGYASEHLEHPQAEEYMQQLQRDKFSKYFTSHAKVNSNGYKEISLPFAGWTRNDDLVMEEEWTIDQYIGFQSSIGFVCMYMEDNPRHDILNEIQDKLLRIMGDKDDPNKDTRLKVTWPLFMLLGQKPL